MEKASDPHFSGLCFSGLLSSSPPNSSIVSSLSHLRSAITLVFADVGYLSDLHKSRSQTGYVFTIGGTAISWHSQKQTLVAISSNHAEMIALHDACRECVWLRSMTNHIQEASGIVASKEPIVLFEDNAACVAQMKDSYINNDQTKHIPPRFFSYVQELEKNKEVDIQYTRLSDNAVDLFTKALPTTPFRKHIHSIRIRHLRDL